MGCWGCLRGVSMFSLCLPSFSAAAPASPHSAKTRTLGWLILSSKMACRRYSGWVFVSTWPRLHPKTAGISRSIAATPCAAWTIAFYQGLPFAVFRLKPSLMIVAWLACSVAALVIAAWLARSVPAAWLTSTIQYRSFAAYLQLIRIVHCHFYNNPYNACLTDD